MKLIPLRSLVRAQDRLVRLLGNTVEGRSELVATMLRRDASEATAYWLQLVVSIGIATLGLVVGSTAVVIGAMLVAPLMGPIIGLAMGLSSGSPFLVLRSAGRITVSVLVAIAGAATITLLLPFHELNAEISSRASPTMLDLITAGFCALAGVYSSIRPGSDSTTTAAGTAISISLVPPLCASGFGFGTGAWPIAGGAALLFLTNLVAIVFIGTAVFVAAGFNRVDVVRLEREELTQHKQGAHLSRALARRLASAFESRIGPALRFLMPFALLAAVCTPLRSALDEVSWEVRVRTAVRQSIARDARRVLESRIRTERHEVEVVVVLLGNVSDADALRARLDGEIRQLAGVAPHLEILAVPDATAFAGLQSTLVQPHKVEASASAPGLSAAEQLDATRARVRSAVEQVWPSGSLGEALEIELGSVEQGRLRLRIVHLGAELDPANAESVERAAAGALGRPVHVLDGAIPSAPLTRDLGDLALVARVSTGARMAAGIDSVCIRVVRPEQRPHGRRSAAADAELARALDHALAGAPRVSTTRGAEWSVRFTRDDCAVASDGGTAEGGGPDGG